MPALVLFMVDSAAMLQYELQSIGLAGLTLIEAERPVPKDQDVLVALQAMSLNYRDLLMIEGKYYPNLSLPVTPISDAAGVVVSVGKHVDFFQPGDRVMTHFLTEWTDGPYVQDCLPSTLGVPGPGMAREFVALPESALLKMPKDYSFAQAATLPIAGLTAFSALVSEGRLQAGQTVLTLGTGGVSLFALQFSKALGAKVALTSSQDAKLDRASELGADFLVNYRSQPDWEREILEWTGGKGVDVVVENGGIGTLAQSFKAARPGGTIALLGALTGLEGRLNIAPIVMKRLQVRGVLVDSRAVFESMVKVIEDHRIEPVIDSTFAFSELLEALKYMKEGRHFGKIVVVGANSNC